MTSAASSLTFVNKELSYLRVWNQFNTINIIDRTSLLKKKKKIYISQF